MRTGAIPATSAGRADDFDTEASEMRALGDSFWKTCALALGAGAIGMVLGSAAAARGVGGCGHDARLDAAEQNLEKASVLIQAAENPGIVPPFGGHDVRALRAIAYARAAVQDAIDYAENSCN